MGSSLWNYFAGYVIISVKGFSWEKFVNKASQAGLSLRDIEYFTDHVEMKVSLGDVKKLKYCASKSNCRVKILERRGFPFVFQSIRKKGVFMWGLLAFVTMLFVLSTYLWEVRVIGAYRIPREEILAFARDCGIFPGARKKNIDTDKCAGEFILHFGNISWISVSIEGSRAEISIAEALEDSPSPLKDAPSNIVAAKEGVIDRIYVSAGQAAVSEGDTVFEGDLLISGTPLTPVDGELAKGEPVPASGKVFARNTYTISLRLPKTYTEKVFTGEEKSLYTLLLFGREIHLPAFYNADLPAEREFSYEKCPAFGDYKLPLGLRKEYLAFYEEKPSTYTKTEAESILQNRLWQRLSELPSDTSVLEKVSEFTEKTHEFLLETSLTVSESIGKEENF